MTAEIVDTSTVTSTQGVVGAGVANTQHLLPGVPGPAGKPAQKAAQQLAEFKTDKDVLDYSRLVLHKYLGYKNTELWPFSDSQGHTPTPHNGLKHCEYGAWTNSSTRVYVFKMQLEKVRNGSSAAAQRVLAWAYVYHESLHVKTFKNDWGGSHPPSFAAGFKHEVDVSRLAAKWLRNPTDRRFTALLKDPAAKAACKAEAHKDSFNSAEMQKVIDAEPSDPAKHEAYYFDLLKQGEFVPKAVYNYSAAKALRVTYGY